MTVAVFLVKGSDDVLRGEAVSKLIEELVGDDDRSLVLDEHDLDSVTLGSVIDAAQTPPFLTERRIIVARKFGRFSKTDEVQSLLDYLADPLPTSVVVLVWEKAVSPVDTGEPVAKSPRIPPALTKAVAAAGGDVLDTEAPSGRGMAGWLAEQLREAELEVDSRARETISERLGEDVGALVGLIGRLRGAFGPGARLDTDDITPFLGEAGGVPPWDLTDAIDRGHVADALDKLARMMGAGDRHPLAVMATLQTHYLRMVRLDGAGARSDKDAAQVLGMKGSTFPAKKALEQQRRLGAAALRRSTTLLAQADVDLRGARAWPGNLVMEVLVARLASIARQAR